jgi:nitroreductase
MATLEQCVRGRHSTRFFKPDPVPLDILCECLSLAQLAPSNSNIQNWRMTFASGPARDRIVESLQVRRSSMYDEALC